MRKLTKLFLAICLCLVFVKPIFSGDTVLYLNTVEVSTSAATVLDSTLTKKFIRVYNRELFEMRISTHSNLAPGTTEYSMTLPPLSDYIDKFFIYKSTYYGLSMGATSGWADTEVRE